MKVSDLFILHQGNGYELINMESDNLSDINFVARTSQDNGVVAKVNLTNRGPFKAGAITVALGGSVLSSFVQKKDFYTGFHIMVLYPKQEMTLEEKLFYCHCLKRNAYRYQYGRQANKTLKNLELPEIPNWLKNYKINYSRIKTKIQKKNNPIDILNWKKFKISDLFDCKTTKHLIDFEKGNIPYITRSSINNGVSDFIYDDSYKLNLSNCITIGAEGKFAFYQNKEFISGVKIYTLRNNNLNKYNALFICTILNMETYRYSYGRARILEKIKDEVVRIPADKKGNPDWEYMENYIKFLPYSDKI